MASSIVELTPPATHAILPDSSAVVKREPEAPRRLVRAVRLSKPELERICFLARRAGLRPSSYMRRAALANEPSPPRAPRTGRTRFKEPRSVNRQIRFHPSEDERVRRLAGTLRLPLARFIREAAVGYNLRTRAGSALILQLTRIGNNLNQLTRYAHSIRQIDPDGRLQATLDRINRALDQLL